MFYEIWVKRHTLSKNEIIRLLDKYSGLWTNGRALRTKKKSVAKRVKKELEKSYYPYVYVDEKG